MSFIEKQKKITAIDVGTTKICVLVATPIDDTLFEIIGIGKSVSQGLEKGVVVDVAKTIASIREAVKEAELMAGCAIESAAVGVSGSHITTLVSRGMVAIKYKQIQSTDIVAALASARSIPLPEGRQILHVLPQFFILDGHERVENPLGMHAMRLEVQAHIILGSVSCVLNVVKCCQVAGIAITDVVLEQLASADAVLSADERSLGVGMLDIGGGTSDFALYQRGNIVHTKVISIAGNHFTQDLAIGLHSSLAHAELIKKQYARVWIGADGMKEVESIRFDQSVIDPLYVHAIVQPRAEEILHILHQELVVHEMLPFMRSGIVLTGGGSLLSGMKELAQAYFSVPVRIGYPRSSAPMSQSIDSPIYATAYGLLLYVMKHKHHAALDPASGALAQRIFYRMKSWITDFF